MKKNIDYFIKITLLSVFLFLFIGCSGNNGSYMAPLGVLPYTSGKSGAIEGTITAIIEPFKYYHVVSPEDVAENDDDYFEYLTGGEGFAFSTDDRKHYVIIDGSTYEVIYDENSVESGVDISQRYYESKMKSNIRIAGKNYSYNPDYDDEYLLSEVPVGYHEVTVDIEGMEIHKESIMVKSGMTNLDFTIEATEYLSPNYFKNIANIFVTVLKTTEYNDDGEEEEKTKVRYVYNKLTRFTKDEIKVYMDDQALIDNDLTVFKEDFIEMLSLWEEAGADIIFSFVGNREDADITIVWEDNSGYDWSKTDPVFPYRAFKPVMTMGIFNSDGVTPVNTLYRRGVMARGIGLSLGLIGFSGNKNDIMYSGDNFDIDGDVMLSQADKNTLIMLYRTSPVISEKTYNSF